ncbi:MAG: tetratricopeptide repeat protein [Phycisphaerae bacterium]|nr:tetratricopeptide repeat protein [Phycisphaerae bacterium]
MNERVAIALADAVKPIVGEALARRAADAINARRKADRFPPEYQAELLAGSLRSSHFRVLQCLDTDQPNVVHRRLARLAAGGHLAAIVSTNFDRGPDAAFRESGISPRTCSRRDDFTALAQELDHGERSDGRCLLLKLHGSAEDPNTLIDTLAQRKRGVQRDALTCVLHLLRRCHWIFLGWSGGDLAGNESYLGLRGESPRARGFTWLCRTGDTPRAEVVRLQKLYGDRGQIVPCELPSWLTEATIDLLGGEPSTPDQVDEVSLRQLAREKVESYARSWAADLGATQCTTSLASLLVAVGEPGIATTLVESARATMTRNERESNDAPMLDCELGSLYTTAGRDSEALQLFEHAATAFMAAAAPQLSVGARCNAGLIYLARGDWEPAREAFETVLELATKSGDDEQRGIALHNLALVHGCRGEFDLTERCFGDELEILERLGDEPSKAIALNDLGEMLGKTSRYDAAVAALTEALRIRERLGNDRGRALTLGNLAQVQSGRGDLPAAARTYDKIIAVFARLGDDPNRIKTVANQAQVMVDMGRAAGAVPMLRTAIAQAKKLGRDSELAMVLSGLGRAPRESSHAAEARAEFERSIAISTRLRRSAFSCAISTNLRRATAARAMRSQPLNFGKRQNDCASAFTAQRSSKSSRSSRSFVVAVDPR